jgi:SAM-dependent methyltransferase
MLGLDVSHRAIASAREQHQNASLRFDVTDGRALPVASSSFDLALSLEAIEHVDDDRGFVAEIARVLTPAGVFLCSTPNRGVTNPGIRLSDRPFNTHHVREYDLEEFRQVLSTGFERIEVIGQTFYSDIYRRVLAVAGRRLPRLAVGIHQVRKIIGIPWESPRRHQPRAIPRRHAPEVLIAICSGPHR